MAGSDMGSVCSPHSRRGEPFTPGWDPVPTWLKPAPASSLTPGEGQGLQEVAGHCGLCALPSCFSLLHVLSSHTALNMIEPLQALFLLPGRLYPQTSTWLHPHQPGAFVRMVLPYPCSSSTFLAVLFSALASVRPCAVHCSFGAEPVFIQEEG